MSGTSLDGLDIANCRFELKDGRWAFSIVAAETIPYSHDWLVRLQSLPELTGEELLTEHIAYGKFLGGCVREFCQRHPFPVDFVSSHGHTVFHQPHLGFTFQIGAGSAIASACRLPVVYDFRTSDVVLGGQGAPLVPIGDQLLFSHYDYCLNLGGIANISFRQGADRIAFDVAPCNLLLNEISGWVGIPYDEDGKLAASGTVNKNLLQQLDALSYYKQPFPKSLGREDVERDFLPLLRVEPDAANALATVVHHISKQLAAVLPTKTGGKMLVTGGGALNKALARQISIQSECEVILGSQELLHFKEALIFAFLGVLRWRNENNVLSSVTGAPFDHCSGSICMP